MAKQAVDVEWDAEEYIQYKHNIGLAEEIKGTGDCRRYSHLQQWENTGGSH